MEGGAVEGTDGREEEGIVRLYCTSRIGEAKRDGVRLEAAPILDSAFPDGQVHLPALGLWWLLSKSKYTR